MSTYYALACNQCREKTDFVTRTGGSLMWMRMPDGRHNGEHIPEFFERHDDHFDEICVIWEHDSRWADYANWGEAHDGQV